MLETRLYRATSVFGLLAVVVIMFSIVSRPEPLAPEPSPEPFDGALAAGHARALLEVAPERLPGSEDDAAAAGLVREGLEELEGGTVVSEEFEGRFEGDAVELENVILTLPGETDELVVITAPRDCAAGPCAASSAAATGILLELARLVSETHHRRTVAFVSTDGSAAGAAGAKQLAEYLEERPVTGVVVLSQPGVLEPHGRVVVPWSSTADATSAQLVLTAQEAVEAEFTDEPPLPHSTLSELVRLAIPAGLGEQSPLIGAGVDAVALSGTGPRPAEEGEDEEYSVVTIAAMGRTALSLLRTLDNGPAELEHGPGARVPLSGMLVPGWALGLLGMALLLPLMAAALQAGVQAVGRGEPLVAGLGWVASRAAGFVAALALALLLALVGVIPAPAFPFDPARYPFDVGPITILVVMVGGCVAPTVFLARRLAPPRSRMAAVAALGCGYAATGLALWLVNPYLALVAMPSLHLWLWATLPGLRGGLAMRIGLVGAGALLWVGVMAVLGEQLGTGVFGALWQVLLMYTGGHFGVFTVLPVALAAGCVVATLQIGWVEWTDMRAGKAQGSRGVRPIEPPSE